MRTGFRCDPITQSMGRLTGPEGAAGAMIVPFRNGENIIKNAIVDRLESLSFQ